MQLEDMRYLDAVKGLDDLQQRNKELKEELAAVKAAQTPIRKQPARKSSRNSSPADPKRTTRGSKVKSPSNPPSVPDTSSEQPKQRKKKKKSATIVGRPESNPSMEVDQEDPLRAIPVVVSASRRGSDDAASVKSNTSDNDVPGDLATATIWRNAKSGFREFRPECFSHCQRNLTEYACPEARDLDDLSDDEEWIKSETSMPSVNTFLQRWTEALDDEQVFGKQYYNHEARPKIRWALSEFDPVTNNSCPFDSCTHHYWREVRPFPSRIRFVRHIVEWHMHHYPMYVCDPNHGKQSKTCQGIRTPRRGRLIEHLKKVHGQPLTTARKTVMDIHAALVGNLKKIHLPGMRIGTAYFGEVRIANNSKQSAFFNRAWRLGRLDLPELVYEEVKLFRGDKHWNPEEKTTERSNSGSEPEPKRARSDMAGVKSPEEKSSPKATRSVTIDHRSPLQAVSPPSRGILFSTARGRSILGRPGSETKTPGNLQDIGEYPHMNEPGQEVQTLSDPLRNLPSGMSYSEMKKNRGGPTQVGDVRRVERKVSTTTTATREEMTKVITPIRAAPANTPVPKKGPTSVSIARPATSTTPPPKVSPSPAPAVAVASASTMEVENSPVVAAKEPTKVDIPAAKVDIPAAKVDIPAAKVDIPAAKVDIPPAKVDVPPAKVDATPAPSAAGDPGDIRVKVETPPPSYLPTAGSAREEVQDAATNSDPVDWYDLVENKNLGQALPTFRLPGDYFDRQDGPSSDDHLVVFREWMRTLRAIQRTSANRLVRASTEFVTAIQAKEHQRVTQIFEQKAVPEPDPAVVNELNAMKLQVRALD